MKKYLLPWCVMLLAACAGGHLPIVHSLPALQQSFVFQVSRQGEGGDRTQSLLVVDARDAHAWRWIQTDALGAPVARQIWQDGQWRNDGFLPPNPQARQLFIATLPLMLTPAQLQQALPDVQLATGAQGDTTFSRDGRFLWRSTPHGQDAAVIDFGDGEVRTVERLRE